MDMKNSKVSDEVFRIGGTMGNLELQNEFERKLELFDDSKERMPRRNSVSGIREVDSEEEEKMERDW